MASPIFSLNATLSGTEETKEKSASSIGFAYPYGATSYLEVEYFRECRPAEKLSNSAEQKHLTDCQTLKATELRKRYPAEANNHRNMLQRRKKQGRVVNPAFYKFVDFLRHMGPRPSAGATLDRINNSDPEYAPGKVRWADKRTQNNNKGDTLLFYYSRIGDTYTVSRLAGLQKLKPSTIRKRKERGWTDDEIIEGKRTTAIQYKSSISKTPRQKQERPTTAKSQRADQPLWGAAHTFKQNDELARQYRLTHGEEYCLADYELLRETAAEFGIVTSQEKYDRNFELWWAVWWPHVFVDKLPDEAKQTLSRIEQRHGAPLPGRSSETEGTDLAARYNMFVAVSWVPMDQCTYYSKLGTAAASRDADGDQGCAPSPEVQRTAHDLEAGCTKCSGSDSVNSAKERSVSHGRRPGRSDVELSRANARSNIRVRGLKRALAPFSPDQRKPITTALTAAQTLLPDVGQLWAGWADTDPVGTREGAEAHQTKIFCCFCNQLQN